MITQCCNCGCELVIDDVTYASSVRDYGDDLEWECEDCDDGQQSIEYEGRTQALIEALDLEYVSHGKWRSKDQKYYLINPSQHVLEYLSINRLRELPYGEWSVIDTHMMLSPKNLARTKDSDPEQFCYGSYDTFPEAVAGLYQVRLFIAKALEKEKEVA